MFKKYDKVSLFWAGYGPNESGRVRSYIHFHNRPSDAAVTAIFQAYQNMTELTLDEVRRTSNFKGENDGSKAPETTIMHNAVKILVELLDDSLATITIPAVKISLVVKDEIPINNPELLSLVQFFINNDMSPKPLIAIKSVRKAAFAIIESLNQ